MVLLARTAAGEASASFDTLQQCLVDADGVGGVIAAPPIAKAGDQDQIDSTKGDGDILSSKDVTQRTWEQEQKSLG